MAIKVNTLYLSNFNIPHSCVACGAPPGVGTMWKVQGSKSDWTGKRTTGLTLELPLCQQCYDVSRDKGSAKFLTVLGILMAIGACLVGGITMSSITDIDILSIGVGVVLSVAVLFLFQWLGNQVS